MMSSDSLDAICDLAAKTCNGEPDMQEYLRAVLETVPEEARKKAALDRDARKRDRRAWRSRWR